MSDNHIINDESPRDNFTMIPNSVGELGLDPYAFRLYAHLRRVTGDNGACWRSTRTLATECGMSLSKISASKKVLADHGLIQIENRAGAGGMHHHITLVDIWQRNHDHFQGVRVANTNGESVRQANANGECVRVANTMRSPGERINIPCNNIPHEEDPHLGADAPESAPDPDFEFPAAESQLRPQEEALASLSATHDRMVAAQWDGKLSHDWKAATRGWGDELADVRRYKTSHALEPSLPLALYLCSELEQRGVRFDWAHQRAGGAACYWLQEAQRVSRLLGNEKARVDDLLKDAFTRVIGGKLMTIKSPQSLVGITSDFTRAAPLVDEGLAAKRAAIAAALGRS